MACEGRCACGAVTLSVTGDPVTVRQCWCRACQRITGGGPATNAIFPADGVTIAGALRWHGYTADSGATLSRGFCPECGTPVVACNSARPHLRSIRLGLLDPGHGLRPEAVIWTEEAPDWATFTEGLTRFPRQPPPPPPPAG